MTGKKKELNWYFLIGGAIILYLTLSRFQLPVQTEATKVSATLAEDVVIKGSRRSNVDYIIRTEEYKNQFNILNGSFSKGKRGAISNLKKGQMVSLLISNATANELAGGKAITVIGISANGSALLTPEEYYINRKKYRIRLTIYLAFISFMFMLNGITTVPKKINFILIGTFVAVAVLLRIFETGIY